MRVSLENLPPGSPLALKVAAAMQRDDAQRVRLAPHLAAGVDLGADAAEQHRNKKLAHGAPTGFAREDDLHRCIVAIIAAEAVPGVIALHFANGGRRSKVEAAKLKGMGVQSGAPDLLILCPGGRAYGLEIKTDRGTMSKAQKQMAERFRRCGSEYEVARSLAGARLLLQRWGAIHSGASS